MAVPQIVCNVSIGQTRFICFTFDTGIYFGPNGHVAFFSICTNLSMPNEVENEHRCFFQQIKLVLDVCEIEVASRMSASSAVSAKDKRNK